MNEHTIKAARNTTSPIEELPMLLTRQEAADFLRKHVRSLDRLIAQGKIKAVRVGGSVLVPRAEMERILSGGDA